MTTDETESAVARVRMAGFRTASSRDLLAVGLAPLTGATAEMEAAALKLMRTSGNLQKIGDLCPADFARYGLDAHEAMRALAWLELGRRIGSLKERNSEPLTKPEEVVRLLGHLVDERKEHFVAALLDAKNNVTRTATVHIGTLTMSVVNPREVFREAVREGSAAIIVAHNHPSGDPEPSPEDVEVTKKLSDAGKILDIRLIDHVVIGRDRFVSLRERGLIHD